MPQYAIQRLYELTKHRDTFITTEVGQHQMWAAQFYGFEEPNRWLTSGGLGTMGYGFPAAIGVQVAHRDAWCRYRRRRLDPDECIQEMSTARCSTGCRSRCSFSTTSTWAWSASGSSCCTATAVAFLHGILPDFVKLAEAYGGVGFRVEKPADLDGAIEEMIARRQPVICSIAGLRHSPTASR
jgi:acetolactate synthase-1/2/3 large subunit